MKKFLLFFSLLIAFGFSARAAEYEMNTKDQTYDKSTTNELSWTFNDISFLAKKNNGSTAPTQNASTLDVRVYASGTLTITAPTNITAIKIYLSAQGMKRQAPITASEGTVAPQTACTTSSKDVAIDWTGNTASVTFTVGAKAEYGSQGASNAGQLCFKTIVITTSDEGVAVLTPTFSVASGAVDLGTEVEINCATEGASIYYTTDGTEPTNASTKYVAPVTIDEAMTIKAIAYKGADKSSVASASYTIISKCGTLAAAMEKADGEILSYTGDLTVVYKNGLNVYVYDGTDFALLYGSVDCQAGDKLKGGWQAEVDIYSGMFELKPVSTPVVDGTGEIPAPIAITAENIAANYTPAKVASYCVMKGVTFAAATPGTKTNVNVTVGETTVVIRNNFTIASVEAGTYDVLGFIAIYDQGKTQISTNAAKLQFFPIQYTEAKQDGIGAIEADTAAPAQYFNLNGIRIDNPAAGQTVIRVQGGKAAKVRF